MTILAAENFPPYRRPPLTKEYLRGEIPREELPLEAEAWFRKNEIRLRTGVEARKLDPEHQTIIAAGGEEIPYDACVLATGSEPIRLPVPGADDPEILTIRTLEDSDALRERVHPGSRVAVVGSGFIGCEAAASLAMRGAQVTMISLEDLPQKTRLGEEIGQKIRGWLEDYGIALRLGEGVEEIKRRADGGFRISPSGPGPEVEADIVLFGTGVEARTGLAEDAGLEVDEGGILCDTSMHTRTPGVFAAGDVALAHNESAGRRLHVEHWGEALNHGRVAGRIIAGEEAAWDVAPGFWSTIGQRRIKYVAWGDGFDEVRLVDHGGGSFTAWYGMEGVCVGVLTHERDEDYERGRRIVESGGRIPV